jgi:sugar O-acyltransferase (sialic acid O-acetyltransferase NeuD family)
MIIAGAGGHALELKDELERLNPTLVFEFFDNAGYKIDSPLRSYPLLQDLASLPLKFEKSPFFALGIGKPEFREKFLIDFEANGGKYFQVHAITAQISNSVTGLFDAMAFSYVGPNTHLGLGVLINSRANVHHESEIGDFTEIGPGALILGQVKIGKKCRIGAGATLLPGIKIGNSVIVGAGAVVTRNIEDNQTIIGVPAVPLWK